MYIIETVINMNQVEKYIRDKLFEMRDEGYRDFHSKLMPTVEKELVIGVRTPDLRKLSKELFKTPQAEAFMGVLPHKYYEENNLHAFFIEQIRDYDLCIKEIDRFLPFVDNWATCDMMRPKVFARHLSELEGKIREWIQSDYTYTARFGIEMLMVHFLDSNFSPEYPKLVSRVKTDEYYVKMMIAWYFATALAKQYEAVIAYLEQNVLDADTHNKTIQKAVESYRITSDRKEYLRSLKRQLK